MAEPDFSVEKPLAKLDFLAQQQLPIDVPSVAITAGGTHQERDSEAPFTFNFVSFGIRFEATVESVNDHHTLRIEGNLGPVPYRAESPELRSAILTIVRANAEHDIPIFAINPLHHLLVRVVVPVTPPLTAGTLIAGCVEALLIARPYLQLIEEKFAAIHAALLPTQAVDEVAACV